MSRAIYSYLVLELCRTDPGSGHLLRHSQEETSLALIHAARAASKSDFDCARPALLLSFFLPGAIGLGVSNAEVCSQIDAALGFGRIAIAGGDSRRQLLHLLACTSFKNATTVPVILNPPLCSDCSLS